MKKLLIIAVAGLLVLTGCFNTSKKALVTSYDNIYSTDINTLDYTVSEKATDGDHFANFVDGLYENDPSGEFVPALAESHTVSEDKLVYTFKIREGVKWMTQTGEEYADVKAQDWVTALEHAVKAGSKLLPIVEDSIKGLKEYIANPSLGFESVGVKAKGDYELEYTLTKPEPYFLSKTTYGILYPINQEFLNTKGSDFGTAVPDSILYNGPFILESASAKSSITYVKNANYWDKDNVFLENVKFTYNDGSNPTELIKQYEAGSLTGARVFPNSPDYADVKAKYGDSIITSETDGTTFYMSFNVNRQGRKLTSKTTDAEFNATAKALRNRDFRIAIAHAFDRGAYRAQNVGEDLRLSGIRNTLVPPTFVSVPGQDYGQLVTEEMKKLDSEAWKDFKIEDNQDGLYNVELAKQHFAKAKAALEAEGVQFPIRLDLPMIQTSEINVNAAKSQKASIEAALGTENVLVDIQLLDKEAYNNATYFASAGAESDYDLSTSSGWGPDYLDPSTYLDIFNDKSGASLHGLGLDPANSETASASADAVKAVKLDEYTALLNAASAITTDDEARFKAYAKAEAWLNNEMLIVPIYAKGGTPMVTKAVPYSGPFAWSGLSKTKFKWIKIQEKAVTADEKAEAKKAWEKSKASTK